MPVLDFGQSFQAYMAPYHNDGNDVYRECFEAPNRLESFSQFDDLRFSKMSLFPYTQENYNGISKVIEYWFSPSDEVKSIKKSLLDKYQIDPDKTLCVCFRGTDKYKDIEETHYSTFCSKVKDLMEYKELSSILVQTDQEQFLEYFKSEFYQYKITVIEENPRREDKEQVAFMLDANLRIQSAKLFLATMLIMSECRYVINHTGNVARWINLFRGSSKNTIQYITELEVININ